MIKNTLVITNARAVLPDGVSALCDIEISGEKISAIAPKLDTTREVIDAKGGYVFPGFIDVHVHGGGGADFMDGTAEAFHIATEAHLKRGTTTLIPTAMTASEEALGKFILAFLEFKRSSPLAANAPGLHLEGPYFSAASKSSKGAQSSDFIRDVDVDEIERLIKLSHESILRWDAAPEIPGAHKFAEVMKKHGIIAAAAHTDSLAEEAEAAFNAGFSHVTHFYNACSAYRKRGQTVTAGIVEAAYLDDSVSLELIADGKHIPKACLKLALKIKGKRGVIGITDATRLAATDMTKGVLGNIDTGTEVIVDDGVAKLPDLSSFAGSICTMDRALKVLCLDYGISPDIASLMLSTNPARLMGLSEVGEIKPGYLADLVITDCDFNLRRVIKAGKPIGTQL
jgi:N-acetylglucosamine-6-phosphate deacetylase